MSQQVKKRPERVEMLRDKAIQTLQDLRKVAREGHLRGEAQTDAKAFNRSASRWSTWCIERITRATEGGAVETLEETKSLVTAIAKEGEESLELEGFHPVVDRFCHFVRGL
ncbi:MAG: hypothetical protein HYZ53_19580 [Planctomycetes bacterium]|nr:hypothetical protein [Planctomycetota bacterium]